MFGQPICGKTILNFWNSVYTSTEAKSISCSVISPVPIYTLNKVTQQATTCRFQCIYSTYSYLYSNILQKKKKNNNEIREQKTKIKLWAPNIKWKFEFIVFHVYNFQTISKHNRSRFSLIPLWSEGIESKWIILFA